MREAVAAPGAARSRAWVASKPVAARKVGIGMWRSGPRWAAVVAVALLLAPVAIARAEGPSNGSAADRAAIRRLFAEFDRGFSRHDARAMAMTLSPDADFTNMEGVHRRGRSAIEQRMAPLFRGRLSEASRTDTVRSIRFLTPNLAAVDADSVITGTRAVDGSVIPPRKGLMITVLRKQNGRWSIAIFHEAEYRRSPAAPASSK